jgi:hypothetical protein
MSHQLTFVASLLAFSVVCSDAMAQQHVSRRHPVPPPALVQQFRAQVRTDFSMLYAAADKDDGASELAGKLLARGVAPETPVPVQYVCLDEAIRAAAAAQNVGVAIRAIDLLAERFEVSPLDLKTAVLTEISNEASAPATLSALADAWLGLTYNAAAADRYEDAHQAIDTATGLATRARDRLLLADLRDRNRELQQLERDFRAAERAEDVLRNDPDDTRANLTLGEYLCRSKGNFERGLRHIANSGPSRLQDLAARDLAVPADWRSRVALAEDWLEYARSGANHANVAFAARATDWLKKAESMADDAARPGIAEKLSEAAEVQHADSPLGILISRLRPAIERQQLERSPLLACRFDKDPVTETFQVTPEDGAVLIGFNITVGGWFQFTVVRSVQPVFAKAGEMLVGQTYGQPAGPLIEIRPRPGYVVSGLSMKTGARIDELRVQYTRLTKGGLDERHSYWTSPHGGESTGKVQALVTKGKPIVGIYGQSGSEIFSLGVITAR